MIRDAIPKITESILLLRFIIVICRFISDLGMPFSGVKSLHVYCCKAAYSIDSHDLLLSLKTYASFAALVALTLAKFRNQQFPGSCLEHSDCTVERK
jgi:hypothetical protein